MMIPGRFADLPGEVSAADRPSRHGRDEQERHGDVRDEPTVKHDVAASPSAR